MRIKYARFFSSLCISIFIARASLVAQNLPKVSTPTSAIAPTVPAAYNANRINFIRSWEPDMPTADSAIVKSASRTPSEVKQTTDYYDGLGRIIQTVTKGVSPSGNDAVNFHVYDQRGLEVVQYLPYVPKTDNTNDGKFKIDPFNGQRTYYQDTLLNPGASGESIYFSRTVFEASPLNRVINEYVQGNSWALEGGNRPIQTSYLFNSISDSVRLFVQNDAAIIPTSSGFYKPGTLFKDVVTNENGKKTVTFKDKEGRTILEKVQAVFAPGNGHVGWHCTYYVYNNKGQLSFVLSPKATDIIKGTWTISNTLAAELCFLFRFDNRGRLIVTKNPGSDSTEIAYDRRDRVVFSRNGLLKSRWQCQNFYYDSINRQVQYNVCYDTASRRTIQAVLDTTINVGQSKPLPFIPNEWIIPLTYTYYDRYGFTGSHPYSTADQNATRAGSNPYTEASSSSSSNWTKGLVTGKRTFVISDTSWLATTIFYNNKGRVVQTSADNWAKGKDVINMLYDFSGKLLSTFQRHTNSRSISTPSTTLLTMYHYDNDGRQDSLTKILNGDPQLQQTVSLISYDELGKTKQERLGVNNSNQIEALNYVYGLRGFLKSINRNFLNASGSTSNWFGMELSYDAGFDSLQYNGSISGYKWKSVGDGVARAYGFTYDPADRILSGYFSQQNSGSSNWSNNLVNFSVSGINYDANGNINAMKQVGLNGIAIQTIDSLKYGYISNSNRLQFVTDKLNNPTTVLGDFKENVNNESQDYFYDPNGNICKDLNKNIDSILYDEQNNPAIIYVKGEGVIFFIYDGEGTKVGKVVIDTNRIAKVTKTTYANGFVYANVNNTYDTLQYIAHEKGRIRPIYKNTLPIRWSYDYYIKDHLGNIRMILGSKRDTSVYAATMEVSSRATENALFANIDNTAQTLPSGYPTDNTTSPNQYAALTNGNSGKKIGPSIVLRVMYGDSIAIAAKSFYQSLSANTSINNGETMFASLLTALSGVALSDGGVHNAVGGSSPFSSAFNSSILSALKNLDTNQNKVNSPKAYLNYVLFDDQFNMVSSNSGVRQVQGTTGVLYNLIVNKMKIQKTGFLYIYTSNESGADVYYDNLIVTHNSGSLLEENHYYPFGLKMAAISSKALKGSLFPTNKLLFNKKEIQSDEFNDGWSLNMYDYTHRFYDHQIGRFIQVDSLANKFFHLTPYQFASNNPIKNVDLDGFEGLLSPILFGNSSTIIRGPAIEGLMEAGTKVGETGLKVGETALKTAEGTAKVGESSTKSSKFTPEQIQNFQRGNKMEAEQLAGRGLEKNTKPFEFTDPKTGQKGVTVPDAVKPGGGTVEVKNVKTQGLTKQLRGQEVISNGQGVSPELLINQSAKLSKPLIESTFTITRYLILPPVVDNQAVTSPVVAK